VNQRIVYRYLDMSEIVAFALLILEGDVAGRIERR
jgi:hypothetical protein